MKRILTLVAVLAATLLSASRAHAQFGIVGGLTSSKTSFESAVAGVTYKFDLGAGFAIQPSVIYQVKGANLGYLDTAAEGDFKLKTGFIELPVGFQWGPDLMVFRPYVFAEPFIGYRITSSDRGTSNFSDWAVQSKNRLEYGFGLGGGIEIASHLQLSVQWFKNLGPMFGKDAKSPDAAWSEVKDVQNFQGLKVTLGILF